jgi:hypothetical protein
MRATWCGVYFRQQWRIGGLTTEAAFVSVVKSLLFGAELQNFYEKAGLIGGAPNHYTHNRLRNE